MLTLLEKLDKILEEIHNMNNQKKDEYEELFKKKLKQWNIDDPGKLNKSDQKKFFKEIEDAWKNK